MGLRSAPSRKEGHSMRKILSIVVPGAFALMMLAGVAVADNKKADNKSSDNKGNGKVKVYDFSGDTIEGDLIKPEGSTVDARDFSKHNSLIRIRTHFIPEIIKSAEDLP
jgi:hypothetical protein